MKTSWGKLKPSRGTAGLLVALWCVSMGAAQAALSAESTQPLYLDPTQPVEKRTQDLISRLTLEEKATLLNHNGPDLDRLRIKSDKWNQCLHGVCWDRPTTMFPVPIAMAATWDPVLVNEVATAISDEAAGDLQPVARTAGRPSAA